MQYTEEIENLAKFSAKKGSQESEKNQTHTPLPNRTCSHHHL